jgi:hypothetical protein
MASIDRLVAGALLASVMAAAGWLPPLTAAAQGRGDSAPAGTAKAAVTGTLAPMAAGGGAADSASEPVVFAGQAQVSSRVVRDTTFGAPPVLELIVDLGGVTAKGLRSGAAYQVEGQAILQRPLQAFEQLEVGLTFAPRGNPLQARAAIASFGVHYNAAKGITMTPVAIVHPPS